MQGNELKIGNFYIRNLGYIRVLSLYLGTSSNEGTNLTTYMFYDICDISIEEEIKREILKEKLHSKLLARDLIRYVYLGKELSLCENQYKEFETEIRIWYVKNRLLT